MKSEQMRQAYEGIGTALMKAGFRDVTITNDATSKTAEFYGPSGTVTIILKERPEA